MASLLFGIKYKIFILLNKIILEINIICELYDWSETKKGS